MQRPCAGCVHADALDGAVDADDGKRVGQLVADRRAPDLAQQRHHLGGRGAVGAGEAGAVDDRGVEAVAGEHRRDHLRAGGDLPGPPAEADAELLGEDLGEQVIGGHVHQAEQRRERGRGDLGEGLCARGSHAGGGGGPRLDVLRVHRQHQLLDRELRRRQPPQRAAVVVGERAELAAEVADVGGVARRGTTAGGVEQRLVADHLAGDALDPARAELTDELRRGGAEPAVPGPVERAVAERRVAAPLQVQVPVPDPAGAEVAGAEQPGLETWPPGRGRGARRGVVYSFSTDAGGRPTPARSANSAVRAVRS